MSAMDGMPMMWIRMPGQTWPGAAASFLIMWVAMTVAMMLPSLVPALRRYHVLAGGRGAARPGSLTALVGIGYFSVWTVLGAAVFPVGVALSAIAMRQPALARTVPVAVGAVVLVAGALQLTRWKARRLAHHVAVVRSSGSRSSDAGVAWGHGVRLGIDCAYCCAGLMAIPLVVGIMDLRVMAAATVAITAERLLPDGVRAARTVGVLCVAAGLFLIVRAVT
jgi:predicted metal-binding membrane protein